MILKNCNEKRKTQSKSHMKSGQTIKVRKEFRKI
jgi:hypothetical protein